MSLGLTEPLCNQAIRLTEAASVLAVSLNCTKRAPPCPTLGLVRVPTLVVSIVPELAPEMVILLPVIGTPETDPVPEVATKEMLFTSPTVAPEPAISATNDKSLDPLTCTLRLMKVTSPVEEEKDLPEVFLVAP